MFHQNFTLWKSKSPVISWITGLFFLGCPDGLGLFYQNFKKFQSVSNY